MLYLYESSLCSVEFSSAEIIVAEDSNSLEKLKQGCKVFCLQDQDICNTKNIFFLN